MFKISNKYIIKNILDYISLNRTISLFKYNKKAINILGYNKEEIKVFLLMKKVIKPLANIEDYIPILKKILNYREDNVQKEEYLIHLFCQFLNKNNKFIPNINFFNCNKKIYSLLNKFKICYNNNFVESFFHEEYNYEINKYKLFEYANLYAKKIKEVSFLDSNFEYEFEYGKNVKTSTFNIINFLLQFSNIEKIEDRYYLKDDDTRFLAIYNSVNEIANYLRDYKKNYKEEKNIKEINEIFKGLKSYSLYFDKYKRKIIKHVCYNILNNGQNLEELEITEIKNSESFYFINYLKNLKKLNSLVIQKMSDDYSLYNKIAEIIPENSLQKLEVNIYSFEEVLNIINKNKISLKSLTIKINKEQDNNLTLVKTLSKIQNLSKLKIICTFPIIDNKNIEYFSLNKVVNLQISLNINEDLFDFNSFFKKLPNLKNIHFHGINFSNKKSTKRNKNKLINMKLEAININKIKKLKFSYAEKTASFFISMLIHKYPEKNNITELLIENCIFNDKNLFIDLIKSISLYSNLLSLKMNYLSFPNIKIESKIIYSNLQHLKNLEKMSLLGWNFNKELLSLIPFIIENYKYLFELGITCENLNSKDMNSILSSLKQLKYLTKIKMLNNYKNKKSDIYIGGIYYNYMIDLRNIDYYLKHFEDKVHQPEIKINDYFNINDLLTNKNNNDLFYTRNNTKREEFYLYQNIHSYYEIEVQLFLGFFNGSEDEDEDYFSNICEDDENNEDDYNSKDDENSDDDDNSKGDNNNSKDDENSEDYKNDEDEDDDENDNSRFIIYTKNFLFLW